MNKDTTCKLILHADLSQKWNLYNGHTHSVVWNWVKIYEVKVLHTSTLPSDTWIYPSCQYYCSPYIFDSFRPRQNRRHFADDIFKCILLNENVWISINISLKFVPKGLINNIPSLVQIMAWRRPGDKPLSEPMMVNLLTHISVTRPQWVNDVHNVITSPNDCSRHGQGFIYRTSLA